MHKGAAFLAFIYSTLANCKKNESEKIDNMKKKTAEMSSSSNYHQQFCRAFQLMLRHKTLKNSQFSQFSSRQLKKLAEKNENELGNLKVYAIELVCQSDAANLTRSWTGILVLVVLQTFSFDFLTRFFLFCALSFSSFLKKLRDN